MIDLETVHYATLVRLQIAMSALQNLLGATADEVATDDGQAARIAVARDDAVAAIHIAHGGGPDEVPERLMRNWADAAMKRNASKLLHAMRHDDRR
jgi:hypothetical protein